LRDPLSSPHYRHDTLYKFSSPSRVLLRRYNVISDLVNPTLDTLLVVVETLSWSNSFELWNNDTWRDPPSVSLALFEMKVSFTLVMPCGFTVGSVHDAVGLTVLSRTHILIYNRCSIFV
jgi:hypothetical protein